MTSFSLPSLPDLNMPGVPSRRGRRPALNQQQKAAIIVRLLLSEGGNLPLASMPEDLQASLTTELGRMRSVDRDTLAAVIEEFTEELDSIGLSFPGGIEGALGVLDGHISPSTSARMRREAGVAAKGDPWERISGLDIERLVPLLLEESVEVGAVMLSKLSVSTAAKLLERVPGDRARQISYAIQQTAEIGPETVRRIGLSLSAQLEAVPIRAFESEPVQRVGAILNSSLAATRDIVLAGLEATDKVFADQVKRAIFTFSNIPSRLAVRDVSKAIRGVDQEMLVTALSAAAVPYEKAFNYVLENISQRMADTLRDEIADLGPVKEKDGEEAMSGVIAHIRTLEAQGEILLISEDESEL
jgi:flagellar motor switch protein FliG